jgi:TetR/AcrR family fatty acid metabolism transcriptional regulator
MAMEKRERILKAAIKVFARDGFFNAKVEEIARMAGVATGTTYLYFDNKDDLLISIFEEEMVPIIDEMRNEIAQVSHPEEKIRTFIDHHMRMVRTHPDMTQLLEIELRQSSKFIHGYKGTRFKEYLDVIGNAFTEGQEEGIFRTDIQPTLFKQILFGALDQIATNWTLSRSKRLDLDLAAKQIATALLEGVKS